MTFYLLTHAREFERKTNTGQIVAHSLPGMVKRIAWDRVNPSHQLVKLIQEENIVLLHPEGEPLQAAEDHINNYLIIDATWQEARKIFNRSPYLNNVEKRSLLPTVQSNYQLRRNQPEGGLCTAECIIELLTLHRETILARSLKDMYEGFNHKQ